MIINMQNVKVANDAARDILFMFHDMTYFYGAFGGTIDVGTFDAFQFLDPIFEESSGLEGEVDAELLRRGSCVAILCQMHDELCIGNPSVCKSRLWEMTAQKRREGLFDFDETLSAVVDAGLAFDDCKFFDGLPVIYDRFVMYFWKKWAAE